MSRTRKEICQKSRANSRSKALLNDIADLRLWGNVSQYLSRKRIVVPAAIFSDVSDG
jgi:hypothetical protein